MKVDKDFEAEHGFNKSPPDIEIILTDQHGTYIFHDKSRAARFLSYHTKLATTAIKFFLAQKKSPIAQFTVEYGGGENG